MERQKGSRPITRDHDVRLAIAKSATYHNSVTYKRVWMANPKSGTFGFSLTRKPIPKNQKSLFFSQC